MNKFESYSKILPWFMALLLSALTAGCGGGGGGQDPILGGPTLVPFVVSINVTPALTSIPVTGTRQFRATATLSNGSSRNVTATSTWTAVNVPAGGPAVATLSADGVGGGLATGNVIGQSRITATLGALSDSATLNVTGATSLSFVVTPADAFVPVTGTQQYFAFETFTDGQSFNRTALADWTTSNARATVQTTGDPTPGLATGLIANAAPVVITATLGANSATANLTVNAAVSVSFVVTPAAATVPTVPVTGTQQYTAIETFSDGQRFDRTALSDWTTGNARATVQTTGDPLPGLATGVTAGAAPVVITATFTPLVGPALVATSTLTVTSATVVAIVVTPADASIAVGDTQQYTAVAILSDGSPPLDVTANPLTVWASVNDPVGGPAVATVSAVGLATGEVVGAADITATFGGRTNAPAANLTVTAALVGVDLLRAGRFTVLADTFTIAGAVAVVTGDAGAITQTGAPLMLDGTLFDGTDAELTDAISDLTLVIDDIEGRPVDVAFGADINLVTDDIDGGGPLTPGVLTPGIYSVDGVISITGLLQLNGPGLYIFRSTGALNLAANSAVVLTNGATAANVFWVPVGATTLSGNGLTFIGTIMSRAGAITVSDGMGPIVGRVLAPTAALEMTNNLITRP